MFGLFYQILIAILSFSKSLYFGVKICDNAKCMSLNNQVCMVRPTPIDLNLE